MYLLILKMTKTMKFFNTKKARISALMVVAVFAAGIVAYFANGEEPMSDIELANIEALANDEAGGGVHCCPDTGDICVLSSGDVLHDQDEC